MDRQAAVGDSSSSAGDSSALGKWIVNPLYVRGSEGNYIRQFPNNGYQQEFSDLTLLAQGSATSPAGDEHVRSQASAPTDHLVRTQRLLTAGAKSNRGAFSRPCLRSGVAVRGVAIWLASLTWNANWNCKNS